MEDGFKKIELQNNKSQTVTAAKNQVEKKRGEDIQMKKAKNTSGVFSKKLGKVGKIFAILVIVLIIIGVGLYFPAKNLYSQGLKTSEAALRAYTAVKSQNIEQTKTELQTTKDELEKTKKAYSFFSFTGVIPWLGNYYKDGERGLNAAYAGVEAGLISVDALIPYADLLGLKGESAFVSGSADDRIQTAVKTLDKLTPKLKEISEKIEVVQKNLDGIDPNRYPEKFQGKEIRSNLTNVRASVDDLATLFINARPLLENLPSLLGEPEAKRYLVLFQNDKELRPTGGFITAYAVFKIDKGKLIVESSDDIYKLDEKYNPSLSPPKQFIDHLKVYELHLRDANFDPDFKDSMERFEEMYNSIPGAAKVDGIVAVDTHVLVESMKILGSVPAYGTHLTVDNDPRCNCPQVIYELEDYAGRRVGYIREDRKGIIGVLLYQIMQKALGVSPSQYWGQLFQMMLSEFDQRHILAYLHNEQAQTSLESLKFAGKMLDFDGDYLHINDANLGGAKSNLYVKHAIKQNYEKDNDGSIIKTITIDYKNPERGSAGCNLEAGGLCLNGLMPNWVRIYVPKGSELISFENTLDPATSGEAYGKTYFEGYLTVKPESVSQIIVKYKLPKDIKIDGNKLNSYMQKQAGTEGHEVTIQVNGKEVDYFNLTEDKSLTIKL